MRVLLLFLLAAPLYAQNQNWTCVQQPLKTEDPSVDVLCTLKTDSKVVAKITPPLIITASTTDATIAAAAGAFVDSLDGARAKTPSITAKTIVFPAPPPPPAVDVARDAWVAAYQKYRQLQAAVDQSLADVAGEPTNAAKLATAKSDLDKLPMKNEYLVYVR